jgi:hypothetical protein
MIGSEAARVAVCFIWRIGFPHPIKNCRSGATPSRALGQLGRHIPRRAAQPRSLSEAINKVPSPGTHCVLGLGVRFCGDGRLNFNCSKIFVWRGFKVTGPLAVRLGKMKGVRLPREPNSSRYPPLRTTSEYSA